MRYIGCKTLLLYNIKEVIDRHAPTAKSLCDIFSGTSTVARYFKKWYEIYSNDVLYFSYFLQMATIKNPSMPKFELLRQSLNVENSVDYLNCIEITEMKSLPKNLRFFHNNLPFEGFLS